MHTSWHHGIMLHSAWRKRKLSLWCKVIIYALHFHTFQTFINQFLRPRCSAYTLQDRGALLWRKIARAPTPFVRKKRIYIVVYTFLALSYRCNWMEAKISEFSDCRTIINVCGLYVMRDLNSLFILTQSRRLIYTHTHTTTLLSVFHNTIYFYVVRIITTTRHKRTRFYFEFTVLALPILPSCCLIIWPMISFLNTTVCCLRRRRCCFCTIM